MPYQETRPWVSAELRKKALLRKQRISSFFSEWRRALDDIERGQTPYYHWSKRENTADGPDTIPHE